MKTAFLLYTFLLFPLFSNPSSNFTQNSGFATDSIADVALLKGNWKLDLSPQDKTDANFAKMVISNVDNSSFEGFFYRDGVKIREGRINTQLGIIYGALISGDNSGTYNTTFYYKNGILHGTTHSLDKDFLAVWTATKENN